MGSWTSQRGFQSLEVIISLTLFALLFAGIFVLFGSTTVESNGLLKQAKANALVNEALDAVQVMADDDWDALSAGQHGLVFSTDHWELFGSTDVTEDTFFRSVTFTDLETNEKQAVIDVYWSFWGRLVSRTVTTKLTNWQNVEVWGNWGIPIVAGSLDIGPQGQATGVVRSGNYAYLTASTSSGNRPTLFSIDITDPNNPIIIDDYTTEDSFTSLVLIDDTYLYVVGEDDDLYVFNVSNPADIQLNSTHSLDNDGLHIIADDAYAYIGTEDKVEIFDISNPAAPSFLSDYDANTDVHGLSLADNYLYAATSDNNQELLILDLTNINNPSYAGSYDITGSNDGLSVEADGNKLYVGTENNSSTAPELYQFDRSNPTSVVLKNQEDVGGDINQIVTGGPYVYLATGASNLEFQIWQTAGSWAFAYMAGVNMAQVATGITFDDNTIFLSLRSNDAFQVVQPSP